MTFCELTSLGCKWVSLETVEDGEEGKAFIVQRAERLNLDLPSDEEALKASLLEFT